MLKSHLLAGDVCVFPTDTVVGIGCCAYMQDGREVNIKGLQKIFDIKNRETNKKLPWLIGSYQWVERYATDLPFSLEPFASKYWPGGTTLVVSAKDEIDDIFCSTAESCINYKDNTGKQLRTLALRVPKSETLLSLLHQINVPIVCTSANISSEPAVATISEVSQRVLDNADFVFEDAEDYESGTHQPSGEPSKIFDCTSEDFKRLR